MVNGEEVWTTQKLFAEITDFVLFLTFCKFEFLIIFICKCLENFLTKWYFESQHISNQKFFDKKNHNV